MLRTTRRFIAASGLTVAIAGLGIPITSGVANAGCATASPPAVVDCDGIQHASLSGETRGHVDGSGWIEGQGVEDLAATWDYWRSSVLGDPRGPCMATVTCHT